MNILKKGLAPITEQAWNEIELQSERVIKAFLTGRSFADVNGPRGIELGAISTGRLQIPPNQSKTGVNIGIREVMPLIEIRKPFTLELWELDNSSRNAKDIDLSALEKAAKQMAAFEDQCFYYGVKHTHSPGLFNARDIKPTKVSLNIPDFMRALAEQLASFKQEAIDGPFSMILPDQVWIELVGMSTAYPFHKLLKDVIKGNIITHHQNKDIFLVSERGGDFELHLGQDIALGYEGHDNEKVKLFYTESFTYQINGPEAVRVMQVKDK